MRLLLANANTSEALTEALGAVARQAASPGTDIVTATAARGVPVIQTRADLETARTPLMEAVYRHVGGCDGVLVGVSLDLAVQELQQQLHLPVVGMTGAALVAARRQDERVGVITFGHAMTALFEERFPEVERMLIETVDMEAGQAIVQRGDPTLLLELLASAANRLAQRGARIALPMGATVVGLAQAVRARIPVLDCISGAVQELERRVLDSAPRGVTA